MASPSDPRTRIGSVCGAAFPPSKGYVKRKKLEMDRDASTGKEKMTEDLFLPGVSVAHVRARLAAADGDETNGGTFASPNTVHLG
jgi:hypothetical protein